MINFNFIIPIYFIFFIFFVSLFIIYKYYKNINDQNIYIKYLLVFLRSLSIILFLTILLEPIISFNKEISKNKEITLFVDNSKSMSLSLGNYDLKKELDLAKSFFNKHKINYNLYIFGDSIREINKVSEINFSDKSTDLNQILETIRYLNSDEYIIISDGMQNQGMIDFMIDDFYTINSFGVGSLNIEKQDLSIDTLIIISINEDDIEVRCEISSQINYNNKNIDIKISNEKQNNRKISSVDMVSNRSSYFHDFNIDKSYLSTNNIIYIDPLNHELDMDNNYYNLTLDVDDLYKYKVLLISGRLSQNTKYIKNLIQNYSNIELIHYYRFDKFSDFNKIDYDAIIFDSFPINSNTLSILNDINLIENKNFAFFQGPSAIEDYNFYNQFLLEWGYEFIIDNQPNELDRIIYYKGDDNDDNYGNIINKIFPIPIEKSIINNRRESIIYDNHNNTIMDYFDNNFFVFIPSLTKISNQTVKIYKNDNLKFIIKLFLEKVLFGIEKNRIRIYVNKQTQYINKKFNIYADTKNLDTDYSDFSMYLYNKDGSINSKINECKISFDNLYACTTDISSIGDYFIQAKIKSKNGFNIKSNQIDITAHSLDTEVNNIGLNRQVLENISLNSKGKYFNLEKLGGYISSIDINNASMLKVKRITLFNFQIFWFMIIFLLILEWMVRKNRGLL